jgi:heme A synthase
MRSWLALVFGPLIALGAQSVMFALVTPSCAAQSRLALHGSAAGALLVTLVLTALAYGEWTMRHAGGGSADSDEAGGTRRFLAIVATAVAALSSLVILAMWFALWVLSPCDPWP